MSRTVIARSESDEAIQVSARGAMECFASLATTMAAPPIKKRHDSLSQIAREGRTILF
jgi:hypothetical protein